MKSLWTALHNSQEHWKRASRKLIKSFYKYLGVTWTLAKVASSVWDGASSWPSSWVMVVIPLPLAIWESLPASSIKNRLKDKDIWIIIKIGDIFKKIDGSLVVSTNSTFDTSFSGNLISRDSLQGQFTLKYYDDEAHLDSDLQKALKGEASKPINDNRKSKKERYPVGTIAKINPKDQTVYMIAIADINEHGKAAGSEEGIIESLGKLWHYIGERGETEAVTIPVLGTGRTQINIKREQMIIEIIKSFIAACSEKRFCDKLTIVISRKDYIQQEMDIEMIGNYLRYLCQYTSLKNKGDTGGGQAVQ